MSIYNWKCSSWSKILTNEKIIDTVHANCSLVTKFYAAFSRNNRRLSEWSELVVCKWRMQNSCNHFLKCMKLFPCMWLKTQFYLIIFWDNGQMLICFRYEGNVLMRASLETLITIKLMIFLQCYKNSLRLKRTSNLCIYYLLQWKKHVLLYYLNLHANKCVGKISSK